MTQPLTKAQTVAEIRALGMTAKWSTEYQEWTVNYRLDDYSRTKESSYHTDDNVDALATAIRMKAWQKI